MGDSEGRREAGGRKERLDLTTKAAVVSPEYVELFSDDEVNYRYELLCGCNYYEK